MLEGSSARKVVPVSRGFGCPCGHHVQLNWVHPPTGGGMPPAGGGLLGRVHAFTRAVSSLTVKRWAANDMPL
jgi:hypothetical protein